MKKGTIIPTLLAILLIATAWQFIAMRIGFPAIFPSLIHLLNQVVDLFLSTNFVIIILTTIFRGLVGFFIAFSFAFIFATLSAFSQFWKAFFHPIIIITRSIPVISIVLLAIFWFLPHNLPIFISFITMFPILYQNILTGLEQTDLKLIEMAKVFGKSRINQFKTIYLPTSKSIIFDGVSTAMGFGWRAVIIGEVLAQPFRGIGTSMKQAQAFINVSELIAWTVVAIGVSYMFEGIIKTLSKIKFKNTVTGKVDFKLIQRSKEPDLMMINASNLNKNLNNKTILQSFSSDFDNSIITCIKGPSGIGKTTLLRLISKLEKPDKGDVTYNNCKRFAYAFQDLRLIPWLTISENIGYAVSKQSHKHEKINMIMYLLKNLELEEQAQKYPDELSGGQQQRVGLARALAAQSEILLLDEPLTGLDNELKIRIMNFISVWISNYQPIVVWATHENIQLNNLKVRKVFL